MRRVDTQHDAGQCYREMVIVHKERVLSKNH